MLGYAMVFPLIPIYAVNYDADATVIGLMVASFSVAQMVTAPLWGRLSDRLGRRPALLVSLVGSASAFTIFAFADSIGLLFLSRIVQGAAGGTTGVMQAYVGDTVAPEHRAKALGWLSAATNTGVMIGPSVGLLVWQFGPHVPGLAAAALCLVNLFLLWFLLPESKSLTPRSSKPKRSIAGMVRETIRHPTRETSELIWIYAVAMTAFSSMTAVLAIFLMARFGLDESNMGYVFSLMGAVAIVMRAGALGRLIAFFGEVKLMRMGTVFMAFGLLAIPSAESLWLFLLVMTALPIGTALLFPATSALLSGRCDPAQLGQVMGVQQSFGSLARIVGPVWSGAAFDRFGPDVPFHVAGAVVLVVALLTTRVRSTSTRDAPSAHPA